MAHVFVCYDREDRDFAEVVQAKLERAGHKTSMDFDILSAGDDWQDKLDVAIRGSDAIVVIMGPEARASDYVAYEWAFALGAGVKVIPLEVKTTPFPPRLDGLHRLDFTGKNRPWDTLLADVARAEGLRAGHVAADPDTPLAVQEALRAIDSLESSERRAAVTTLAQTNHPTALAALTRALEHPIKDVRAAAALVFPDRGNPKIVPGLIEFYRGELEAWVEDGRHERPPEPDLLFESAGRTGASSISAMVDALKQVALEPRKHHRLRQALLLALGKTKSIMALPPLQEALEDDDAQIRCTAAEAIGELEELAGAAALRTALADSDEGVRREAAESLGRLKDVAAVPGLIACLGDDTSLVRTRAAEALGKLGDRSALPALVAALHDHDYSVNKAAADALGRLGDQTAISHLRARLPRNNQGFVTEIDMTVMAALVRLRDAASLDDIGNLLLNFKGGKFGGDVYEELARYGDEGIRVLLRVLQSENRIAPQSEAAKALESIRRPDVVDALKAWKKRR